MKHLLWEFELWEYILAGVMTVVFLVQLIFYLGKYGRIPVYRQKVSKATPAVSVVVVVDDNLYYMENILPRLLEQDYDNYELVVVDNGSSAEVIELLQAYTHRYPHMKHTRINPDPKFKQRRKFALTVGIKAAGADNILFTDTAAYPPSSKWVSLLAKGFTTGQVVIGYCGIEPKKGFANKLIRCSRMNDAVRSLSSAVRGRAYKGHRANLGLTSTLYFGNKGYNFLNLNIGDDDLFVQKIADKKNTAVILHPEATVREPFYGGLGKWFSERSFYSYTYRYYPASVKAGIFTELFSRFLFFGTTIAAIAMMIPILWIVAVSMLALRWLAVLFTLSRISIRLGEKGLMGAVLIHDLLAPFTEFFLCLSRSLRPGKGIWI